MSIITHHIPVTTGQAHHMTLRLVQSYGAPVALSDYNVYGSILQDGETIPVSVTGTDASGILLTLPPLYPGRHPYNLHLKHNASGTDYLFLQGNCDTSELIGADPMDNRAVEQITVAMKDDLSGVTVTMQIDSETTAGAWEEIEAVARKTEGLQETISNLIPEARIEIAQATDMGKNDIAATTQTAIANITTSASETAEETISSINTASATIMETAKQDMTSFTVARQQDLETTAASGQQAISTAVTTGTGTINAAVTTGTGTINTAVANGKTSIDNYVAATQADFVRKSQANIWSGIQTFNNNVVLNGTTTLTSTTLTAQSALSAQYGAMGLYIRSAAGSWRPMRYAFASSRNHTQTIGYDVVVYDRRPRWPGPPSTILYLNQKSWETDQGRGSIYLCFGNNADPATIISNKQIGLEVRCGLQLIAHWQCCGTNTYYTRAILPCKIRDVVAVGLIRSHKSTQWWVGDSGYLMIQDRAGSWYRVGHWGTYGSTAAGYASASDYMAIHTPDVWPTIDIEGGIVTTPFSEYYQNPPIPNQVQGYNGMMGGSLLSTRPCISCPELVSESSTIIDEGLLCGKTVNIPASSHTITASLLCRYRTITYDSAQCQWYDRAITWSLAKSDNSLSAAFAISTASATNELTISIPANTTSSQRTYRVCIHGNDNASTVYSILIVQDAATI